MDTNYKAKLEEATEIYNDIVRGVEQDGMIVWVGIHPSKAGVYSMAVELYRFNRGIADKIEFEQSLSGCYNLRIIKHGLLEGREKAKSFLFNL